MNYSDGHVDLAHGRLADRLAEADRARLRSLARQSRRNSAQSPPIWRRKLRLPAAWRRVPVAHGRGVAVGREPLTTAGD